ncbi:hypothetical protein DFO78_102159 [Bacillus subtilis]|nr:hypothetical protein DFO78_102159 [Bacillus subtilis]
MGRMIDIPLSKSIAIFLLSTEAKNNYITNTLFFIYYYCFILFSLISSEHFASKFEVNYSVEIISTSKMRLYSLSTANFEVIH